MIDAVIYAASGAVVGSLGALYVCAVLKFKQVERKCLKTCTPIALFAMVMLFLFFYVVQLVLLLPQGYDGVTRVVMLVLLGMFAYTQTWRVAKPWLTKSKQTYN